MQETTTLRTVYDIGKSSMRYDLAAIPFIFTIVGVILIVYSLKTHSDKNNRSIVLVIGLIMSVGSLLMSNLMLNSNDHKKTQNLLTSGNYKTVQDTVRNYKMDYNRSMWYISFDLGATHFDLADNNVMNYGCTASDIKDSRIMNGIFLYVDYYVSDSGSKILRIRRE
jgi:hypothetical protein